MPSTDRSSTPTPAVGSPRPSCNRPIIMWSIAAIIERHPSTSSSAGYGGISSGPRARYRCAAGLTDAGTGTSRSGTRSTGACSASAAEVAVELTVHVGDHRLPLRGETALRVAHRVEPALLALHVADVLARDQAPVLLVVGRVPALEPRLALRLEPFGVRGERPDLEARALGVVVVRTEAVGE